ncbi:hypothetical protein DM02DRAFT_710275 [Periconia macrospinosa]|uniref:ubiquitinyl hydrolase 1 n=1 Tax=Periconia macrospinosa TaxID=97972 RepID=A0A2V1DR62_9PLEO|nr:hypothetical protein DM02DRAFT_710275 [Periconia macrospinosa]
MATAVEPAPASTFSPEATAYLIHHVVFPAKLPQENDRNSEHERCLIDITIRSLEDLRSVIEPHYDGPVRTAIASINNLRDSRNGDGSIVEGQIQNQLCELAEGTTDGLVLLEIKEQNAGLIASRSDDGIRFEVFELSPASQSIMETQGRLVRSFPELASKIPLWRMQDRDVQATISGTLSKLSSQAAYGFQPRVRKQQWSHNEVRDTTHPGMATDFLMNLFTAIGELGEVDAITKNTRDDVLWDDCVIPWRRSPLWLLIRVFLHLFLGRIGTPRKETDSLYKAFMVMLLSRILRAARMTWAHVGDDGIHTTSAKLLRRLRKMEDSGKREGLLATWKDQSRCDILAAHSVLSGKQQEMIEDADTNIDLTALQNLNPEDDQDTTLPGLDEFLTQLMSARDDVQPSLSDPATSVYPSVTADILPTEIDEFGTDKISQLASIEKWVKKYLQSWILSHEGDLETCTEIRKLIQTYHRLAQDAYKDIPSALSVMILTILELYVASDKSACTTFPLLREYRLEVDICEVQCLLLPSRDQMDRARKVEQYFRERESAAKRKLPSAKAVVFELQAPKTFTDWRDTSMYIIADILGMRAEWVQCPHRSYTLATHHGLNHLISKGYSDRRIIPSSSVKPHVVTHRKKKRNVQNLMEDDVCLANALRYEYYDRSKRIWSSAYRLNEEILQRYVPQIPDRSKTLERYLHKPPSAPDGITPNEVIANVSDCPMHFAIDEFRALAVLPYGCNNIYSNILVQLASPVVDFSKAETQILVFQILHQMGPSDGSIERTTHSVLTETRFCEAIVAQLERCIEQMAENWEAWRAATIFAEIAKRVLSLTNSQMIQQRVMKYLTKIRTVYMKWISRLQQSANSSTDNQHRSNLRSVAAEIALVGANTFCIDEKFWEDVFQSQQDASMLFRFSSIFQELHKSIDSESTSQLRATVQTWKSFMYNIFPFLLEIIATDASGLNEAIKLSWAAFQPSANQNWRLEGHWLRITSGALPVHFNLLTAEILVNGLPLARLPAEYMGHPMYQPLFQKHTLEVVPTAEPGMKFAAKSPYQGYALDFGMMGEDMLILAKKEDTSRNFEVRSRQYRNMVLDSNQDLGSLYGLDSKLVLRNEKSIEDRMILIPEGLIRYTKLPNQHVSVKIEKGTVKKMHAYPLDSILGRILDSGNLQSKLLLCYLHALTSHCLPDRLTRRTGFESAISILESAAVRSFPVLTQDNVTLLNLIGRLTPRREFYPPELKVMQQVFWDKALSSLSQHPKFNINVQNLYRSVERMKLYYPEEEDLEFDAPNRVDSHLQERFTIRCSTFYIHGSGAESFTLKHDRPYIPRSTSGDGERGKRAFIIANMFMTAPFVFHERVANLNKILIAKYFKQETVTGAHSPVAASDLRYDTKWLCDMSTTLRELWCSLYRAITVTPSDYRKYDVMTWLATMAYAETADMATIQALAYFYKTSAIAKYQPPQAISFRLYMGDTWNKAKIRSIVTGATRSRESCPEGKLAQSNNESLGAFKSRVDELFKRNVTEATTIFIHRLENQWPCSTPFIPTSNEIDTYLDTEKIKVDIQNQFKAWWDNQLFYKYLNNISSKVKHQQAHTIRPADLLSPRILPRRPVEENRHLDSIEVFSTSPPAILFTYLNDQSNSADTAACLQYLCQRLEMLAKSEPEKGYVKNLRSSCTSLQQTIGGATEKHAPLNRKERGILEAHLEECSRRLVDLNHQLAQVAMGTEGQVNELAFSVQHSPRICPTFWLSHLRRDLFHKLTREWQKAIVEYGLAITEFHRARRLFELADKPVELYEELHNEGHTNWEPLTYPERLLLEVESGLMVRKVQEVIARAMLNPPNEENIVCQLNMGEGKSSVIVPTVASHLADGKKLVRVIVARPQSTQMFQMLVSKLGGLLNRVIYQMPFSREIELDDAGAENLRALYEECMANSGILLVQPEHILSFKLMAIDRILNDDDKVAKSLLSTQSFFDRVCRDMVDESDENFSVKFELVYTSGCQRGIDFSPERWKIIQEMMGLISQLAPQVHNRRPDSIEFQYDTDGKFPRIRLLHESAADDLLDLAARHVVEHGLTGLPIRNLPPQIQAAVFHYITQQELKDNNIAIVENSSLWTGHAKSALLLVRGLFAGGILRFALSSKRWRVNFGQDLTRKPTTKLALPYRSKDAPSPRSEFSHPEVIIIFTTLSYYYGGLTNEELFDMFTHVLKSDQSAIHFDEWVRTASQELPMAFRQLSGISIKDRLQCIDKVFPFMRYSKLAIDYYLSQFIFPKEMKEFPHKMSASGWDIGAKKANPTTGFSGTNDTLHLLPLSVTSLDLPSQSHTNALVLGYLLQEETSVHIISPTNGSSDAEHLLNIVNNMTPEVRVVLDVGALILEMNNLEVSQYWLARNESAQAVVFFQGEELSVLDRSGRIESFQTSPYAKQLDSCLIYLDEAHTRGTDLKLPRNYRAAVTLGVNLTKDRLIQACMRMRKLGKGQSVVFMVPPEISTKIKDRTNLPTDGIIHPTDVLCWSIMETWSDLTRSMPLWAVQGLQYQKHKDLIHGPSTTKEEAARYLEEEAQSIEVRYRPRDGDGLEVQGLDTENENVRRIIHRCRKFGTANFRSASLQEEQERELAPEIEEEKQVERPAPMKPTRHQLHKDVQSLVVTGTIPSNSTAFQPAFQALSSTSAAELSDLTQFPCDLLVTTDFIRTIVMPATSTFETFITDSYQRNVQWVLSVGRDSDVYSPIRTLVILSPFEVNKLYPLVRSSRHVSLHLFSPRWNARVPSLDHLTLYSVGKTFQSNLVGSNLRAQLNLFAGSLYLRSFDEYHKLCDLLGLLKGQATHGQDVSADGFINPPVGKWGLTRSPVAFLRVLIMKIRKEGEGVEKTHMGKILSGVRLEEADFEGMDA